MVHTSHALDLSDFDLTGKRALVTGGGDGLGRQFTEALLDAGAEVIIASRRKEFLDNVVSELKKRYERISAERCDVTNYDEVVALAARIGMVDILVNSSGLAHRAPWWEEQSLDWKRIMTLNVEAPFWLSQLFLPGMIKNHWGRIINISSIYGVVAGDERRYPGLGVHMPSYFTSKHALIGLTKFLAAQVAKSGVTVNALCPGSFDSPVNRQYFSPGPLLDAVSEATPMGRIGSDRELRTALLFLAAPGSSFITGQALVVDGGWTIW
ncbi:MAG: SDR family NAD(P)-dependent oxidoreductase [Actinomycetota bacterium]